MRQLFFWLKAIFSHLVHLYANNKLSVNC